MTILFCTLLCDSRDSLVEFIKYSLELDSSARVLLHTCAGRRIRVYMHPCANACQVTWCLQGAQKPFEIFYCHSRGHGFHSTNCTVCLPRSGGGLVWRANRVCKGVPVSPLVHIYFSRVFFWKQFQTYSEVTRLRVGQRIRALLNVLRTFAVRVCGFFVWTIRGEVAYISWPFTPGHRGVCFLGIRLLS